MQMVQAVDLRSHAIKQLPHIGMPSVDMKAIGRSIRKLVACLRAVDQQLLGHATSDHAGAADAVTLEDGHLGAMACRAFGGCKSTGASADHHKVEGGAHVSALEADAAILLPDLRC